jgi:hypothetical protein
MAEDKKTGKVELEINQELLIFAGFYGELLGIGLHEFLQKLLEHGLEDVKEKINALPFTSLDALETRVSEGFPKPR